MIEWDNTLSVKHKDMDDQHQKLIDFINAFFAAVKDGNIERQRHYLKEIFTYAVLHFDEEEKLLESINYPDLNKHKIIHRNMITRLRDYDGEVNHHGFTGASKEMMFFLKNWILAHIKGIDQKYTGYIG